MFCPNCGVRNLGDAKFCRSCGADIRLVPQAMTGQLAEAASISHDVEGRIKEEAKKRKRKLKEQPTLEKGLENIFVGIAFLVIFMLGLFYFRGAFMLWVWFIIPALACVGEGIGQVIRSRLTPHVLAQTEIAQSAIYESSTQPGALHAPQTSEIVMPPASITEGTTRKLSVPADRGARDA